MLLRAILIVLALAAPAAAQDLQAILQENAAEVEKPSRSTVDAVIEALLAADPPARAASSTPGKAGASGAGTRTAGSTRAATRAAAAS